MSQPPAEPGSEALAEQFMAVAHAVRQRVNARMTAAGLSLARARMLRTLAGAGPMRMKELSDALGVVPRTVTTMADSLEKEGLLARAPDPRDRRATLLQVTDAGRGQLRELKAARGAGAAALFEALSPAERQQLAALLAHLAAAAEAHTAGQPGPASQQPSRQDR